MAWSLGSLFVDLKVNTAQFLDGMTKASSYAHKTGRDIENGLGRAGAILAPLGEAGEKIASVLDGVGSAAERAFSNIGKFGGGLGLLVAGTGAATALGGALFALADHASEVGSKIFEASEKTGISADKMSGLMALAKETGVDFESLSSSVAKAGVNLEKGIINPGGEAGKVLSQVMGSAKNLSDLGLKPVADRIQVVISKIFAMRDPLERNIALSTLMGKGWQSDVSALKLLAEQGYGPAIEQAKKFGVFFDDGAAAKAKNFQIALAETKNELSGLGVALGQEVIPWFSKFVFMVQGMIPNIESTGYALAAMALFMVGDFKNAAKAWDEHTQKSKEATQAMTDFQANLDKLRAGAKAATGDTGQLNSTFKAQRDVLAELIAKEKEQIALLASNNHLVRAAKSEYDETTREIAKATAAGGSFAESLTAQALAADLFAKKLSQIPAVLPQIPGMGELARGAAGPAPNPALPSGGIPGGSLPLNLPAFQSIDDLAKLRSALDSTKGYFKALRDEEDLSGSSLKILAERFSGLTTYQIAATAEGRKLISILTQIDKESGSLSGHLADLQAKLIANGSNPFGKMIDALSNSVDQLEDSLARLAVTGKGSFKQIYQGLGESLVKSGLQKGVSVLAGGLHLSGGGVKRDGSTAQSSIFVTPVTDSGKSIGSMLGSPGGLGTFGLPPAPKPASGDSSSIFNGGLTKELGSVFGGLNSSLHGVFNAFGSIGKSIGGIFGSIFGGLLADGGDVTPGKAYIVGEKRPEWFIPGRSGHVAPSLSTQTLRPVTYSQTYNISTPNADSFRRTQSQLLAEGHRAMAHAHAKNS